MLGELEQILEPTDRLDLGQVDDRLYGFALAEVEAKRLPGLRAVLVGEPETEQPPRRIAHAWVVLRSPGVHTSPDPVDRVHPLARLASLRHPVRVAARRRKLVAGHLIVTSASFVVSLPKMSMILITIA